MTDIKVSSNTLSLAALEKVPKLQDHEGYLKWKRIMKDYLKVLKLWTYVGGIQTAPPEEGADAAAVTAWTIGHDDACTALRLTVEGNAYSDIENLTNAAESWTLLEKNFKPRGAGFLNETYSKLDTTMLADCKSPADYTSKFRSIINELNTYSSKVKMDENWLIYRFHTNLGPEHSSYFESYAREHDPFTEDGEIKSTLSEAMHHFQNTVRNPISIKSSQSTVALVAANMPAEQKTVQTGAQLGTNNCRVVTLQKTVKYCTFCKRDYHTEDECRIKHPHLAPKATDKKPGNGKRRRPDGKGSKDGKGKAKAGEESDSGYFAENETIVFMAGQWQDTTPMAKRWIWDCGCTQHVSNDRASFTNFRELKDQKPVKGLAGSLTPLGVGTINLTCVTENGPQALTLNNTLYIPGASANLISQGQLQRAGRKLEITPAGINLGSGIIARLAPNNLYPLDIVGESVSSPPSLTTEALSAVNEDAVKMWHSRLGHLSEQNIRRLENMSEGMDLTKPPATDACEPCTVANLKTEPHKDSIEFGKAALDLVHSDVMGPFQEAYNGARYAVTFLDDYLQASDVYFLKQKAGVFGAFKHFRQHHERGDTRVRRLRTDNGGEFNSKEWEAYEEEHGVTWEPTIPGNPQMNGKSERLGQTLHTKASAMLKESGLHQSYWPELFETANYLRNRQPTSGRDITPYEASTGRKPQLGHLRRIGQYGWAQARKPSTGWKKLQDRAIKCVLMGYKGDHIYKMLTPSHQILSFSNVKWIDNAALSKRSAPESGETPKAKRQRLFAPTSETEKPEHGGQSNEDETIEFLNSITTSTSKSSEMLPPPPPSPASPSPSTQRAISFTSNSSSRTTSPAPSKPVTRQQIHAAASTATTHQAPIANRQEILATHPELREPSPDPLAMVMLLSAATTTEPEEPKTFKQATAPYNHKRSKWWLGMEEEIQSHKDNNTWIITTLPQGQKALDGKWVYKIKRGPDGEITRYKCRWVVKGYEQRAGIDYAETFASVVKPMSYKAIFAMAAARDWDLHHMDVKTAYLNGHLEEDVYVKQPEGFGDETGRVCKLNKGLYGLKQSARVWYRRLARFLISMGMKAINADLSVFAKEGLIIAIYVDDLLVTGASLDQIKAAKASLNKEFHMSDLGPCTFYLGMTVTRDRRNRRLSLCQAAYLEKVLREHNMWECKAAPTPMDKPPEPADPDHKASAEDCLRYQSAVGSLMYAMLGTRPDLAFAVSVVSRYASNPNEAHWQAVKRIFRYIKGTIGLKLTYRGKMDDLTGYSDADWAGDHDTRRSTSGFVFNVGSGAISWQSKRQPTVALSTCEAEYMAQTQATKEAVWLKELLRELDCPASRDPSLALISHNNSDIYALNAVIIHCDNQGAVALAKNPQFHARSKHIDIQYHYQREKIEDGTVELQYVPTENQIADGLTKALAKDKFMAFRKALGLE